MVLGEFNSVVFTSKEKENKYQASIFLMRLDGVLPYQKFGRGEFSLEKFGSTCM